MLVDDEDDGPESFLSYGGHFLKKGVRKMWTEFFATHIIKASQADRCHEKCGLHDRRMMMWRMVMVMTMAKGFCVHACKLPLHSL